MRVNKDKIKNVKADNAFKEVGTPVKPLTDEEYKKIATLYRGMKDFEAPIKFDDQTDLIICKIPDQLKPKEVQMADGTSRWQIRVITQDGKWWSLLTDEAEKKDFEGYLGCKLAVVGKLIEKAGKTKDGAEANFQNINKYRGSMLLDIEPPVETESESDSKEAKI